MINQSNIDRFVGFADVYDKHRPSAPKAVADIIKLYLGKTPETVADIGCGTGLSTMIWTGIASSVIGVEPGDDMRAVAKAKAAACKNVRFIKGYSNNTGLDSASVDAVTISQAFHWMDYGSTLREASRILKPGGVFAVYDCDWPPAVDWQIEREYNRLYKICDEISSRAESSVERKNKEKHLAAIQDCGLFAYTREIVFHNSEPLNAERMTGILLSQGGVQTAMKADKSVKSELERFSAFIRERMGKKAIDAVFSYRIRLGVKE